MVFKSCLSGNQIKSNGIKGLENNPCPSPQFSSPSSIFLHYKFTFGENSQVVQWLGLSTSPAGAWVQSQAGKLRSHKLCGRTEKKKKNDLWSIKQPFPKYNSGQLMTKITCITNNQVRNEFGFTLYFVPPSPRTLSCFLQCH